MTDFLLLRAAHPRARVISCLFLVQDRSLELKGVYLAFMREPWCAKLNIITRFCLLGVKQLKQLFFVDLFSTEFFGFG